jgi:hypothetical protein
MRLPPVFAPLLRERSVCLSLIAVGVILVGANMLGIPMWRCAFHEVTGLPCPGCGLTRGMSALARGRWGQAVEWNIGTPVFALGIVLMMLATLLPDRVRAPWIAGLERIEQQTGIVLITLTSLMIWGVWRMMAGTFPG